MGVLTKVQKLFANKYITNSYWLVIEKLIRLGFGIFVSIVLARYLGPENFGTLNYVISIVAIIGTIVTLGLEPIVIKQLLNPGIDKAKLLSTAFFMRVVVSLIGIIICLVFGFDSIENETSGLITIVVFMILFQTTNVIDIYFQSKVKSKYVAISQSVSFLLTSAIKLILVFYSSGLSSFGYAVVIESVLLSLFLIVFYRMQNTEKFRFQVDLSLGKALIKESWPIIFSSLIIALYMKIDTIMIKHLIDAKSVGYYAVAAKMSTAWYFIPVAICSSLYPKILNNKADCESKYYKELEVLFSFMFWLSLSIAILVSVIGVNFIRALYGMEYEIAGKVLVVHIWAAIFVFLGVAGEKWFYSEGLQKLTLYRVTLGALLNICLNLYMIPKYGILGAAYATLISQSVTSLLLNCLFSRTRVLFISMCKGIVLPLKYIKSAHITK